MSDAVLETLLRPFETGALPWPTGDQRILVLRGRAHHTFKRLAGRPEMTQTFKPQADRLVRDGFEVIDERDALAAGQWDWIFVLPPRSRDESRSLIADAADALSEQGRVLVSVANAEGAKGMETDLKALFGTVGNDTKNKCRVMWTRPRVQQHTDNALKAQWQQLTRIRPQRSSGLMTRPGVFSWEHPDVASTLLMEQMPSTLRGKAADLGAGVGHLAHALLSKNLGIVSVDCYEAQLPAIELIELNLAGFERPVRAIWADVEQGIEPQYDVIVMNPPFHALSRDGRTDIGIRFIQVAAQALKSHGTLLMVANRHLPYESTVRDLFTDIQVLDERQGFKVIKARKA